MRTANNTHLIALILLSMFVGARAFAAPIEPGDGQQSAHLPGLDLTVFTIGLAALIAASFWFSTASIAMPINIATMRAASATVYA